MSRRRKDVPQLKTEMALAKIVVDWLDADGWETYKEVETRVGVVDIVAKRGFVLWCIETKRRLNDQVMRQCFDRAMGFHYISAAINHQGSRHGGYWEPNFVDRWFLRETGIGCLNVRWDTWEDKWRVDQVMQAQLNRHTSTAVSRKMLANMYLRLHPDQRECLAGAPGGGHITSWKRTMRAVYTLLKEKGWMTSKAIIEAVPHHYSNDRTARAGVVRAMGQLLPGFRNEIRDGHPVWDIERDEAGKPLPEPHFMRDKEAILS